MKRLLLPALIILTIVITACSATLSPLPTQPPSDPVSTVSASPEFDSATRIDDQGAIIFEVTPLDLNQTAESLEFNIVLTTHSIDLGMDLATTATLSTDTGVSVNSTLWDAPRGGHHVEGKLIFPAAQDGKSILDGARKLTLTITNVDVPTRIFEWELK
jgi:hypothetical protein